MYFQPTSAFFSRQLSWFPKQKSPDIQNKQIQPKLALLARHWSSRKLQPQQTIFFRFSASPPTKLPPPPRKFNSSPRENRESQLWKLIWSNHPSGSGPPGPQPSSGPPSRFGCEKRDGKPFEVGVGWKGPQGGLGCPKILFQGNNSGEDGGQIMDFGSNCNDWKLGKTHTWMKLEEALTLPIKWCSGNFKRLPLKTIQRIYEMHTLIMELFCDMDISMISLRFCVGGTFAS